MPLSGQACRKCRVGNCQEGDTWCLLCSCVATLGEVAKHRYHLPSFRHFAEELVHQVTTSLDKQVYSQFTSLTDRLNNAQSRLSEVCDTAQPKSAARQRERSAAPVTAKEEVSEAKDKKGEESDKADYGDTSSSEEEQPPPEGHRGEPTEEEPRASARGQKGPPNLRILHLHPLELLKRRGRGRDLAAGIEGDAVEHTIKPTIGPCTSRKRSSTSGPSWSRSNSATPAGGAVSADEQRR